ncbi:MAG: hypothetical protein P4L10_09000 [Acidobacteriaceae bacterium]|nr:hypothetical protein [Acidobacteriaceae bacterium]
MTTVDVLYRYGVPPAESAMIALNDLREVYGIRRIDFSEAAKTVLVEYDATRLTEPTIRGLLGRTGLNIIEAVSTLPPQPTPEELAAAAAAKEAAALAAKK